MKQHNTTRYLAYREGIKLLLIIIFLLNGSFVFSQTTDPSVSPQGVLDKVTDRFGKVYKLSDISQSKIPNPTNPPSMEQSCNSNSIFRLYFEPGSGMEDTSNAVHNARRAVVCKVFKNLSDFLSPLDAPLQPGATTKVNIWIRDITTQSAPADAGAVASSYFISPSNAAGTTSGILDGEVWKTIHLGADSYTNVAYSSSVLYHGMMAVNFNNPSITWHTDLTTDAAAGERDLYTAVLHEAMHLLGIHSFINENGGSLTGAKYYSRFDTFLKTNGNTPLLTFGACLFDVGFNSANVSATVLRPGCSIPGNVNPNNSINTTICNQAIRYVNTSYNVPLFTPTCYEPGSSLSHFEDMLYPNCTTPYGNDNHFVVSNNLPNAITKRYLKPEERSSLCDIGYKVKTTFGSNTTSHGFFDYGGTSCSGISVAGITDGITPTSGYAFSGSIAATGAWSTDVYITGLLANDRNATSYACLEEMTAPGTTTITNTASGSNTTVCTYKTTTPGLHLLRYIPKNGSEYGNITYVYVYITPPPRIGGCSPTPSACDLVMNGGFEQYSTLPTGPYEIIKACGWDSPTYSSVSTSAYYNADYDNDPITIHPVDIPCNLWGYQESKNNVGKGYADVLRVDWNTRQHLYTRLKTPLQAGVQYQLSFDVSLMDNLSNFVTNLQAYLSPTLTATEPWSGDLIIPPGSTMLKTFPTVTRNATGWDTITFNVTSATGGEQYLYLGILKNSVAVSNTPSTTPSCSTGEIGDESFPFFGYYVDNVSLIPTNGGVFNLPDNLCVNQTLSNLTTYLASVPTNGTFSVNGTTLSGNSFSSSVIGNVTIGYTYTSSGCSFTLYDTINVTNSTVFTPTFSFPTSFCSGTTAPTLPTTSNNGITGTWNPLTVSNTLSKVYTFTPTTGQCASTTPISVTVNPAPVVTSILPSTQTVCLNSTPINLQVNANYATSYQWYSNTTNSNSGGSVIVGATSAAYTPVTSAAGTKYYYVVMTNTAGCVTTSSVLTVIIASGSVSAGTLSGNQILCKNAKPSPTTVITASVPGGTWSTSNPAIAVINSSTSTTATIRVSPGTATIYYTVTGSHGCTNTVSIVLTTVYQTTPTFSQFPINPGVGLPDPVVVCYGGTVPTLPTTSQEGITGTWSPTSTIDNTISEDYTFVPTAGLCATGVFLPVVVLSPNSIVANNDVFSVAFPTSATTTSSILANDTYFGVGLDSAPSSVTQTITPVGTAPTFPSGGITLNPNGTYTVLANTTPGAYTFSYKLATNCGFSNTASVTIIVNPYVTHPGKIAFKFCYSPTCHYDTSSSSPYNSLFNMALVGPSPANAGNAIIFVTSTLPPGDVIVINSNGTLTVDTCTPGSYQFYYRIFALYGGYLSDPIRCDITIESPITAVEDSIIFSTNGTGPSSFNVLANDFRKNANCDVLAVTTSNVSVTPVDLFSPYYSITTSGIINRNPTAPIGTYNLRYKICDLANPSICSTVNVNVYQAINAKMNQNNIGFDLNTIVVSPNPSDAVFEITFNEPLPYNASYDVYDMLGKKIFESTIGQSATKSILNLENQPQGVYLLRINLDGNTVSKLLMKK